MADTMKWVMNHMPKTEDKNLPIMSVEEVKKHGPFIRAFPSIRKRR